MAHCRGSRVMTDEELTRQRIDELGPWFHNMRLGGVWTAPEHFLGDYPNVKWQRFAHAIPADLTGRTVLDIGCNGGFYAIEMKRRGAERVVAVDAEPTIWPRPASPPRSPGSRSSSVSSRSTTWAASASGSTSSCFWAFSIICAIRSWPST